MESMSIFLLKDPHCVLIHIPKTGGTSIRKGVWKKNYEGPAFGSVPDHWRGFFKFAFVRHPLDRLVSAYKMFSEGAIGDQDWSMASDHRDLTFEEFLDIVMDETIIFDERRSTFEEKIRHHTIPQTHPFNALADADFVGRYENLEKDFQFVAERVGALRHLPRMHYTRRGHWQDYFSPALEERCRAYFAEDFDRLGY